MKDMIMEVDINNLNTHILVVDDMPSIHDDFKEILHKYDNKNTDAIEDLEDFLFQDDEENSGSDSPDTKARKDKLVHLHYNLEDAYQGDEAVEIVRKYENTDNPICVIIMDVRMPPGINGIEAIMKIWKINPYIEIVICSAYSDYSWDQIVDLVGTTDRLLFLKKPFHSIEIQQMILSLVIKWNYHKQNRHFINHLEREVEQRTNQVQKLNFELEAANKVLEGKNRQLAEMALKDGMTGLFNHMAFQERFKDIFNQSRRHSFPMSIAMIDIDLFKEINDNYGHSVGDKVITRVAEVLKESLSSSGQFSSGVAGRYGGDEFALIFPYCGVEETRMILEKIRGEVRNISIENYPDLKITASLGGASLDSHTECGDSESFIHCADSALYQSKKQGRDQVMVLLFGEQKQ